MKNFVLSLIAVVLFAMPAMAQDGGLIDRVSKLEAKVEERLKAIEGKMDNLIVALSAKTAVATPPACPCIVANGVCVCQPKTATASGINPGPYYPDGSRMLPNAPPVQYLDWSQAGGNCANGSCGSNGSFRLFGRRR